MAEEYTAYGGTKYPATPARLGEAQSGETTMNDILAGLGDWAAKNPGWAVASGLGLVWLVLSKFRKI